MSGRRNEATASDGAEPARAAERDARRFGDQRAADRGSLAQDYVELIADLLDATGEARPVDLARRLGVTQATVANTVARLKRDGLVRGEPYRGLFLTDEGRALAERVRARHALVLRFLLALGVERTAAEADAEGIEHHVGEATLAAMARFVERSEASSRARKTT